ncbi:MAG: Ig-like domain-containing protein, partial [Clostridia bacterium]|nr:Ig-like domain-containing protein [Clostridia bacterium]
TVVIVLSYGAVPALADINSLTVDASESADLVKIFTLNNFVKGGGVRILEADIKISEGATSGGVRFTRKDGNLVPWNPAYYNGAKLLLASTGTRENSAVKALTVTEGQTYRLVCVMELTDTAGTADIYIDGVLQVEGRTAGVPTGRAETTADGDWWRGFFAYPGTKATLYQPANLTALADFDLSVWNARVTTTDEIITVDNTKMSINAGRAPITAAEFLSRLTLPTGSSAKVTLSGEEVAAGTTLTSEMLLDVTLKYGNKISYTISAGFVPLTSDVYDVSLSFEGDVASGKISGVSAYTPVSKLKESLSLGKDGTQIGDVTPLGDFAAAGMKLAIESIDGDTVYYDIELTESFTSFEDNDGLLQVKNLKDKITGKEMLILGSIDIPESGLAEDAKLYYEMDVKRGYPVEFLTDGSVKIWGNNVGNTQNGKSYDYAVLTDAKGGCVTAYINGVKVLTEAGLNNQFDKDSNPYELACDNYNPAEYGDFLLTEVYSATAYGDFYTPNLAMVSGDNDNVSIAHNGIGDASLNLFVDETYSVSDLTAAISAMGEGTISFYDENGEEVTEPSTLVSSLASVSVTSKNGLYSAKYDIVITQDILKGEGYTVDLEEKTIGTLLSYTPIDAFLPKLVVRPDYTLLGVYRNGEAVNAGTVADGDILKLEKSGIEYDYAILIEPDMTEIQGVYNIKDGTQNSVTVIEGTFTVPENGVYSDMRMRFTNPDTGRSLSAFLEITSSGIMVWKSNLCTVEAGKSYTFAIINDHKTSKAQVYLNGVKLLSNYSTTSWMLANEQLTVMSPDSVYKDYITDFRFYKVYSVADFAYDNDLEIIAALPNTVEKKPNLITVNDDGVKTVSDLLAALMFPTDYIKNNAVITGNGVEITDVNTSLRNDMVLTVTSKGGLSADYEINLTKMPITSYVFDVTDSTISYNGNITYDDFIRYALPSDGVEIVVKDALGTPVTSGQLASDMSAEAGGKTYTLSITGTTTLPTYAISEIAQEEIYKTTDTYEKSITVSGTDITDVVAYFDGESSSIGAGEGTFSFTKNTLTSGRHEIYFAVYTAAGKTVTPKYALYAFENETERLRAARQPAVIAVNYIDAGGAVLPEADRVSFEKTAAIELVFNKRLTESSINPQNIALYEGENKLNVDVEYKENTETAYYAAVITLEDSLKASTEYKIWLSGSITDFDTNTAKDESKIVFKTEAVPFDVLEEITVNTSGSMVTDISAGDSIVQRVDLTNTSLENKSGVIALVIFDGNKMAGYSLTEFSLPKGTVAKTVTTNTAQVSSAAGEALTVYRYIWDDINMMQTLLRASEATYK